MHSLRDTKNGADGGIQLVAVAIDKDKASQNALKWTLENLVSRGQTLTLIHVNTKVHSSGHYDDACYKQPTDPQTKEIFLPFRCFCTRKNVHCKDVVLEDPDVAKAIVDFAATAAIEKLVVGSSAKGGFMRFKNNDIASNITKGAPDFCTVYVISKNKISSMRNAARPAPAISPLRAQIQSQPSIKSDTASQRSSVSSRAPSEMSLDNAEDSIRSPFSRGKYGSSSVKPYADLPFSDSDISFVSSGRPSIDRAFAPRISNGAESLDYSFESVRTPMKSVDPYSTGYEFSSISQSSAGSWTSSNNMDDIESEMNRLRLELKQTMEMYSTACKEALTAKQKAIELNRWKMEEERRLEEAKLAGEAALEVAEREKAKCREAIEQAEASQRIAELEAQKRLNAEMKALKEAEEKHRALDALSHKDLRYRRYRIEEIELATENFAENRKIGEGGYGPVFRCHLDHTPVAVKVLRPDAAQGRTQFQQEVEVLSCIRHPNMVLLLGACPEYGCLVYEYMANGSLDDCLFRKGNTPPIPWKHRFRIAAEIATGLLFLHQTKPEPLVHRDLKPGNILLDRNFVSKISDVGLARLVPPSVADTVTQYRMTSTAGTFCYIDPEYQQTGMLGVKSDIYSLGIMLLQIITAKPPMGLTHHVSRAIEKGTFADMLDPAVTDWPLEETQKFAELALQCAELRRKDRPDLCTIVLPELNKLRYLAEDDIPYFFMQDVTSDPLYSRSGYDNSRSQTSASSIPGRRSNAE